MEKNKELTPMMELIEWNNSRDRFSQLTWVELYTKLKELLPKEKQVIEDAWENGYEHASGVNTDPDKYHGNQYYNTKYNNQIK